MGTLQTTTLNLPIDVNSPCVAVARERLWAIVGGGADMTNPGVRLWYSEDGGGSWTDFAQLDGDPTYGGALVTYQDSVGVWHLHAVYGPTNNPSKPLKHRALHSGVARYPTLNTTPGTLTAALTIDAGGSNQGASQPNLFVTNTGNNPRLWVAYRKTKSASTWQLNLAYATTGTAADMPWTVMSDVGSLLSGSSTKFARGVWWRLMGAERATLIATDTKASPNTLVAFTFDPTAEPVILPAAVNVGATLTFENMGNTGETFSVAAIEGYILAGRRDPNDAVLPGKWSFYASNDAVTWTNGFESTASEPMGRLALVADEVHVWAVYTTTFDALTGVGSPVNYRSLVPVVSGQATLLASNANALSATIWKGKVQAIVRSGSATLVVSSVVAANATTGIRATAPAVVSPQEYQDAVLQMKPVAYYRLNETSGAMTMADSSGNGHGGTYSPTLDGTRPTFGAIKSDSDTAVAFSGASQYASATSVPDLSIGPNGLSIAFWMRPDKLLFDGVPGIQVKSTYSGALQQTFVQGAQFFLDLTSASGFQIGSAGVFDTGGAFHVLNITAVNGITKRLTGTSSDSDFTIPVGAPVVQGSNYLYILGKGMSGAQEFAVRFYSSDDLSSTPRPNRVSGYSFNAATSLGTGTYYQVAGGLTVGTYTFFVVTFSPHRGWPDPSVGNYRQQGVNLYRNGALVGGVEYTTTGLESYWGSDVKSYSTILSQSLTFPVAVSSDVAVADVSNLRPVGAILPGAPLRVVIIDDGGNPHLLNYTSKDSTVTPNLLIGAKSPTGDLLGGTASSGHPVTQGEWMIAPTASSAAFFIATRNSMEGGFFVGAIDEVAVFSRVLTDAEVYALYSVGRASVRDGGS